MNATTPPRREQAHLLERLVRERRRHGQREAVLLRQIDALREQLLLSEAQRHAAEARADAARADAAAQRDRAEQLGHANRELAAGVGRIWELTRTLADARAEASRFARERDELLDERTALEELLAAQTGDSGADAGPRVLCVGAEPGLARICDGFARRLGFALVQRNDAGADALAAADVVLCPSHAVDDAGLTQLRDRCRHAGKPCVLYRGSGPAGMAVALSRLSLGGVAAHGLN
ncbi:hypothetical protein [Derxia lacustris]|uniref:hypothetical protein n=1 Tax=Derxia lacustris TaxID=764842 RepID=UPI000A16CF61|nr:hypothetical protein [Derxia lacustris]